MWIQIDIGIREHDKIYNLADALEITDSHAVGLMVCLWTWAATAAPDGDITNFPPRAIERAAGWDEKPGKFFEAIRSEKSKFVETDENGHLHFRNWGERAGLMLEAIERNKEQTRERVRRFREKKTPKMLDNMAGSLENTNEYDSNCNVTRYQTLHKNQCNDDHVIDINSCSSSMSGFSQSNVSFDINQQLTDENKPKNGNGNGYVTRYVTDDVTHGNADVTCLPNHTLPNHKDLKRSLLSELPPADSDDRNFSIASDESMTSEAEPNEIGDGGYTRQEVLEGQNDTSGNIKAQQKSRKKAVYPHDSQYYKAAKWLADSIEDRVTDYKKHTEATLQSWADSARLLFERDKRDKKQVFELLKFSQEDDFWKNNILSMPKFREKFDVLKIRYDSKSDKIAANVATAPAAKQNRFVNFTQWDIDYAELERLENEQLKARYMDD